MSSDLFSHSLCGFSLVVIHPPLFKTVLEPVLDDLVELSVSHSADRLTWGIPVHGDSSQTVSLSTTKLVRVVLIYSRVKHFRLW